MRRVITLLLTFLLLSACAAPAEESPETPEVPETPVQTVPEEAYPEIGETEDRVLLTLEAPLADGRTLTLEAVGKVEDEYSTRVREVRVYDGDRLVQTVQAREGNMAFWGGGGLLPGESVSEYTHCWVPEGCAEAVDLNFDGNTDFGLFAFPVNNIIPYYYWIWDPETEQYRYAFTLQGAEAYPDERELRTSFRVSPVRWEMDYYTPDENGALYLTRVETDDWELSGLDDRAAQETWVPEPGVRISPGDQDWSYSELTLLRRELPVRERHEDGAVSHYTEVWEFYDNEPKLVRREEIFYEHEQ